MRLGEILREYFKDHNQAEFAKAIGVKDSTVSRWKNDKIPPNFENCLQIARIFNEHPITIFDYAGRAEYVELFKYFSPEYKTIEISKEINEMQSRHAGFVAEMKTIAESMLEKCAAIDGSQNGGRRKKRN